MPIRMFHSVFALVPYMMMAGYITLAVIFILLFYRFVRAVEKVAGKIENSSEI